MLSFQIILVDAKGQYIGIFHFYEVKLWDGILPLQYCCQVTNLCGLIKFV